MTVRGKKVLHCHGKHKGETISTEKSHSAAVRKHKAIEANKKK